MLYSPITPDDGLTCDPSWYGEEYIYMPFHSIGISNCFTVFSVVALIPPGTLNQKLDETRTLSQNVTNAPDCRTDTELGTKCVKTA